MLQSTTVAPGDCIFLESGLCHALGEGIVVAEIQTPSDTTFRVWDWNRNDPARPLHIEQAMSCVRLGVEQASSWPRITGLMNQPRPNMAGFECGRWWTATGSRSNDSSRATPTTG